MSVDTDVGHTHTRLATGRLMQVRISMQIPAQVDTDMPSCTRSDADAGSCLRRHSVVPPPKLHTRGPRFLPTWMHVPIYIDTWMHADTRIQIRNHIDLDTDVNIGAHADGHRATDKVAAGAGQSYRQRHDLDIGIESTCRRRHSCTQIGPDIYPRLHGYR